jgi:hypothetical protein
LDRQFSEKAGQYEKILKPYHKLSLQEYRDMLSLRVDGLVVKNKRLLNPIDDLDRGAWFCNIWKRESSDFSTLSATLRVRLGYNEVCGDDGYYYNYPIFDRCVVVDPEIDMFYGSKPMHLYCGDWTAEIYGVKCGSFTTYPWAAPILDKVPELTKVGENMDENGDPGIVYVSQEFDRDECNRLMFEKWFDNYAYDF